MKQPVQWNVTRVLFTAHLFFLKGDIHRKPWLWIGRNRKLPKRKLQKNSSADKRRKTKEARAEALKKQRAAAKAEKKNRPWPKRKRLETRRLELTYCLESGTQLEQEWNTTGTQPLEVEHPLFLVFSIPWLHQLLVFPQPQNHCPARWRTKSKTFCGRTVAEWPRRPWNSGTPVATLKASKKASGPSLRTTTLETPRHEQRPTKTFAPSVPTHSEGPHTPKSVPNSKRKLKNASKKPCDVSMFEAKPLASWTAEPK